MKSLLFVLGFCLISLVYQNCGICNKVVANFVEYQETCVGGVMYYQFPSGVAVARTPDGEVKICK